MDATKMRVEGETRLPATGRKIVLATFGSLGDLHPYLAIALELRRRGHRPVLATSEIYRGMVESLGLEFHPVRPDMSADLDVPDVYRQIMDRKTGMEYILGRIFMPSVADSHADLGDACRGADLLVTQIMAFGGPLIAEQTGIPWVSTVLAPSGFLSKFDPPVMEPMLLMKALRRLGPRLSGLLLGLGKRRVRSWVAPVDRLRADLGLPPGANPVCEGQHSPDCVLALFSAVLGAPQPDWPTQTIQIGFPFFDRKEDAGLDPALARFLDAGEPPIVFTLGSAAVMAAGNFFEESLAAAIRLGRRAVLLIGDDPRNRPRVGLPESVAAFPYAPFSEIFPRAAAIVHQGGVGTTGQALRAGRPMLVVPWAHDQFDNAARAVRLGVARTISQERCTAGRVVRELQHLLDKPGYATRSAEVGRRVRDEDGTSLACDAIERQFATHAPDRDRPDRTVA